MRNYLLPVLLASALLTSLVSAQEAAIDLSTPEGQMLRTIDQEPDVARKIALCETFLHTYPNHPGAVPVYSQLLQLYVDTQAAGKALAICDDAIRTAPDNLYISLNCLKSAVAAVDAARIVSLASRTFAMAKKETAAPKPAAEDQVDAWKNEVDYARQVSQYSDWALYAAIPKVSDPAAVTTLYETLEKQDPQSEYLGRARQAYFTRLQQTGQTQQALEFAERVLATDESSEDMLLAVAGDLMQKKKDPQKVIDYSEKIISSLKTKPAPEGVSPEAWEQKKNQMTGVAGWMAGVTYATEDKWLDADKALREALPLVETDRQVYAETLFYLGLANYKLGDKTPPDTRRIADAVKFSRQCAAVAGPYQAPAQQNLKSITAKYPAK